MNPAAWFFDHSFHVFPVDRRDKSPMVPKGTSQFDYRCSRLDAVAMGDYGVPLGLLAVADSDSPEVEAWVAANLPETPFKVTTARGRHRYYRLSGDAPHYFHRAGHTIEFRHKGQYVVGPGSVHATGVTYAADPWSWKVEDIPLFPAATFEWDDRPLDQRGSAEGCAFVMPPVVMAGERHDVMFKLMRSLQARGVTDVDGILAALQAENLAKCSPPISYQELERYIRRVVKYPDREGFDRVVQEDWTLAGRLVDAGVSGQATLLAVKSVYPDFDPDKPDAQEMQTVEADDEDNLQVVDVEEFK